MGSQASGLLNALQKERRHAQRKMEKCEEKMNKATKECEDAKSCFTAVDERYTVVLGALQEACPATEKTDEDVAPGKTDYEESMEKRKRF